LSALARVPDLTIDRFDGHVATGALVRMRAMRYSVHTIPVEVVPVICAAMRSVTRKTNSRRRPVEDRYATVAAAIDRALASGPLPAMQLRQRVDPERELGEHFSIILGMAAADFKVVRTTTTGSWRSDRFLYARWKDWLPGVDPNRIDDLDAKRELVSRYVTAYGPVEIEDVKWWTGWTKAETLEAIDGVDLGVAGDAMSALGGVKLLPVWDAMLVAYRNRDRLFDPSYSPLIHDRFGNATSVVLHKGRVVGQWDLGSKDSPLEIKVAPFSKWSRPLWEGVEEQAHRIARLIDAKSVTVVPIDEPVDLLDSSRNRFLAPLSKR
jgi:hypothetical protein